MAVALRTVLQDGISSVVYQWGVRERRDSDVWDRVSVPSAFEVI